MQTSGIILDCAKFYFFLILEKKILEKKIPEKKILYFKILEKKFGF